MARYYWISAAKTYRGPVQSISVIYNYYHFYYYYFYFRRHKCDKAYNTNSRCLHYNLNAIEHVWLIVKMLLKLHIGLRKTIKGIWKIWSQICLFFRLWRRVLPTVEYCRICIDIVVYNRYQMELHFPPLLPAVIKTRLPPRISAVTVKERMATVVKFIQ